MGRPERETDEELLLNALRRPAGFGVFYRRHVDGVLAYFMRRARDPEVATDLAAEVFAAALEASPRYDRDRGPPVAWLYGIARNVLSNSLRRGRADDDARRRLGMEPLVLEDAALARVEDLGAGRLDALLAELPEEQRAAVVARVLDERDYADIAGELGCSTSVVRKRVSRGLTTLRCRVGEDA